MKNFIKFFFVLFISLSSSHLYSGPIIIKLSGLLGNFSNIAIKVSSDGKEIVFGKFVSLNDYTFDVQGFKVSFHEFKKYDKFSAMVISPDGVLPIDISSRYGSNNSVEYFFRVFALDIAVKKTGSSYEVQLRNNRWDLISKFGFEIDDNSKKDGPPYIYEPYNNDFFASASKGWLKGNEYIRLYPHSYRWTSLTADQNYLSIIYDEPTKHFDLLFGQGLFEYIVKRNFEEMDKYNEEELANRQIQTLILLSIFTKYKDKIILDYINSFALTNAFDYINKTLNHPKQLTLWVKNSERIQREVENIKNKLPKLK